ncbi:protein JINGUBANG [Ziziphus jujuba]|uniref:Protein JINGUBANG n=1 Tax=Ziziphus jujuba TaxID=326968 RepID=A0A6P3ZXI3_ZIZJJ|nr:protein JINGUBANG [Ziziphus jujuba]
MEFQRKKSLYNFIDEETNTSQTPIHLTIGTDYEMYEQEEHLQLSPSFPSSPNPTMLKQLLPPPSPESPWTLSPFQTPSPALLYHCIASLYRQEGTIFSIAISKNVVFTGSESSRIRTWRQQDFMECGHLKAKTGEVRAILVHGNVLFATYKDHRVRMWNFAADSDNFRCKKISSIPKRSSFPSFFKTNNHQQHRDCISCLAYYHAEGLLYTGSHDRTVKAWKISTMKCVDTFLAHEEKINALVINQEDGCVFTCSSDCSVKIWRRLYRENSHTLTMTLKFQPCSVNSIALSCSRNSWFLYSGSSDGNINFWEKEMMSCRYNHGGFLQGHRFAVLCLATAGNLIFSGSEDTTIRVWKREERDCFHECLAVLDGHRGPVRCLAACLEMENVVMGCLVYSASLDQTFKVWRVKVLVERKHCLDRMDRNDSRTKAVEYEMNPVLSPSWVQKKLQGPMHQ